MQKKIIQIAGVKNQQEVELLLKNNVDLIGYPLRLPVNVEDTTEEIAREIINKTHSFNKSVLITYLAKADEIIDFCDFLNVKIVQLHGDIKLKELEKLKKNQPNIQIIKSLVVGLLSEDEIEKLIHYSYPLVDYFITDTYNPVTGATGATGLIHDWKISREIVELSPKPVILAGGLNADNVAEAIRFVKPVGVDVHTGIEDAQGNKDKVLVREFIKNAKEAFQKIEHEDIISKNVSDTLDLHTFHPRDVKNLVHDFLDDCIQNKFQEIRIIHGKGKGVLRDIVHAELVKDDRVLSFKLANDRFSSWGATVVKLKS